MPKVCFTSNLRRHVDCPEQVVSATTVGGALDIVFSQNPRLKAYVLDEQGTLHRHMTILVNGQAIRERRHFALPVEEHDEIFIMQALSGG